MGGLIASCHPHYLCQSSESQVPRCARFLGRAQENGHRRRNLGFSRQQHSGVKIQTNPQNVGMAEDMFSPQDNGCFLAYVFIVQLILGISQKLRPKVGMHLEKPCPRDELKRMPQWHSRRAGQCKPKENPGTSRHPNRDVAKTTRRVCRNFRHTLLDYFYIHTLFQSISYTISIMMLISIHYF